MKTHRKTVSDGVQTLYDIDFDLGYLEQSHVYVYAGTDNTIYNSQLEYIWVNSTQIELTNPAEYPAGVIINIRRVVPRDVLYVEFKNSIGITETALNKGNLQALMLLEENADGFKIEGYYEKQNLNFGNLYKIINLVDGTDNQDAVTVKQMVTADTELETVLTARVDIVVDLVNELESTVIEASKDSIQYAIGERPIGVANEPAEGSSKFWAAIASTQAGDKVAQTAIDGSAVIPAGTIAQRDATPANGFFRYNSETKRFEGYVDSLWQYFTSRGDTTRYYANEQLVTNSYSIPAGFNAMSVSPLTISEGVVITIEDGSTYTIM